MSQQSSWWPVLPILALTVSGCGSDGAGYSTLNPPDSGAASGVQGANSDGSGSSGSSGSSGGSGGTSITGSVGMPAVTTGSIDLTGGIGSSTSSTTGGGGGDPEVCDGVDNDGNGIVDDVDAGGDGVCDCLNIATVGQIGPWSNGGNVFASWLDARSPIGAVGLDDQVLTAEVLIPFQVIVVLHVDTTEVSNGDRAAAAHHAFSDAEAAAFGDWVQQGGGVMTTIGYTGDEAAEVVNVNRLLQPIGLGYSTTNLDLTGYIQTWEPHPVTMGVSNIFTDNGVEPDATGGLTVAFGSGGGDMQPPQPALQVAEAGAGRAVLWGDEWITYDSEWADVEDQQIELFWINILKWLSPPMTCQVPTPPDIIK